MNQTNSFCNNEGSGSSGGCFCNVLMCCEENGCESGHTYGWEHGGCVEEWQVPDDCGCCQTGTPIIVSLRGQAIQLSSAADGVVFDFYGDGHPRRWAWPRDSNDAWLALDRNENGQIDSAAELFGDVAPLASGEAAGNGYQLLDEMDVNRDGFVDARDPMFARILVWRDSHRNGVVDRGELVTASRAGIKRLGTEFRVSKRTDQWGNAFRLIGKVFFDKAPFERFSVDVFLTSTPPSS